MTERMFYAYVEVEEYGEPPREVKIGPFHADSRDELWDILEREGERVLTIEEPVD